MGADVDPQIYYERHCVHICVTVAVHGRLVQKECPSLISLIRHIIAAFSSSWKKKKHETENLELQPKRREREGDVSVSRPLTQRQSLLAESVQRGS